MKTNVLLLLGLLPLGLITGCDRGPKSGRGFVFPEGDMARGQKAFVDLKCYTCHRVDGIPDLPAPLVSAEKVVVLGGAVARLRTYGDLVTSVIHPSYALSENYNRPVGPEKTESPMKAVNDTMTVTQLLDIVTFLQPHYRQLEPLYQPYYGR